MKIWKEERILKINKNSAGGIITAGQVSANDMIIWTMIMLPVNIILYGAGQCFVAVGLFAGTVFTWLFLAKRLRSYIELSDVEIHHVGDFFQARYHTRALKFVISVLWILFIGMMFLAVVQYTVRIMEDYLELPKAVCTGLLVLVLPAMVGILPEKALHGLKMVVFSAMIVILLLIVVTVFTIHTSVEVLDIYGKARLAGGTSIYLNIMYYNGEPVGIFHLISMLGTGITCVGMPFIYKGIIGVRDEKELDRARVMAIVFSGATVVISSIVALLTRVCIYPVKVYKGNHAFHAYNLILHSLYQKNLYGDLIRIIALCFYILSILILAGSFMRIMAELFRELIPGQKKKGNSKDSLETAKDLLVLVLIGILTFLMVWLSGYHTEKLVTFAWNLCGSMLAGPCFACFMWKNSSKSGIFAGIISGGLGYICWQLLPLYRGMTLYEATGLTGLVVAAVFSLLLIGVTSIFTKKPDEQELKIFEQMKMRQK